MEDRSAQRFGQLHILESVLQAMLEHARSQAPLECCGLLAGHPPLIDEIVPADNARQSEREFLVPPPQLFDFLRRLRSSGKRFLGIYHSHPKSPPFPSPRDVQGFHYPEVSYWIVSLATSPPQVRCFEWRGEGFCEVEYEVVAE